MTKKILSIILALVMVLAMAPVSVFAEDDIIEHLTYAIDDGGVTITRCDRTISGDIVIPDTIEGYPVISIGETAFDCANITSITVPESVTSIDGFAIGFDIIYTDYGYMVNSIYNFVIYGYVGSAAESYADMNGITFVSVSPENDGDNDVLNYLTYEISNNGGVIITGCNTSISGDVVIPATIEGYPVTTIGDAVFSGCVNITSIILPLGVTYIGWYAFESCESLVSIVIPDLIVPGEIEIQGEAFFGCSSLESITIPYGVTSISNGTFAQCESLTSVTIPECVTTIGDSAFSGCTSLENISISASVESIGMSAFENCTSLTSVSIPDSVVSIAGWAFFNCTSLDSIEIPESVTSIGTYACGYLSGVQIVDDFIIYGVSGSSAETYANENGITFINIDSNEEPDEPTPDESESIIDNGSCGDNAEWILYENGELVISGTGTMFDYDDWYYKAPWYAYADAITTVIIDDGITNIGDWAFYQCVNLENITIPDSVISIGYGAFDGCSSLESITIPDSVTKIDGWVFCNCSSLTEITIPDSVTSVGSYIAYGSAYYYDESNWENDVLYIGKHLIEAKYDITECTIRTDTLTIAENSFAGCSELKNIEIPDSVISIGDWAFSHCTGLESVEISNNVTTISNCLFYECTSLKNVTIPESVQSIGCDAFHGCTELESIEIPNSVEIIDGYAFMNCNSLTSVTIPASVMTIENRAIGYYFVGYDEWLIEIYDIMDGFTIYGCAGSSAETYANENGITFIAIEPEEDVVVPDEPIIDAPVVDDPVVDDPVVDDPVVDEPETDEPGKDEPVQDEPTPDKPIQDTTSTTLNPNKDSHITVTDTVANLTPEMSIDVFIASVENENVQILDKDGKEIAADEFVGTGSKIMVLDNDGNILTQYEVMVKSDVDGNGKVTPADARLALRAAAGLDTIEGVYETAANFDEQDVISPSDARMILRKAAGLE